MKRWIYSHLLTQQRGVHYLQTLVSAIQLTGRKAAGKKKTVWETHERRREGERLTLTPSGFLFSRLLAAVERGGQDDGSGLEEVTVNAPFTRGDPVCGTETGPAGWKLRCVPD